MHANPSLHPVYVFLALISAVWLYYNRNTFDIEVQSYTAAYTLQTHHTLTSLELLGVDFNYAPRLS